MRTNGTPTIGTTTSGRPTNGTTGERSPSETITSWSDTADLTDYIFSAERAAGRADRQRLNGYAAADRAGVWIRAGHKDMAEWVAANCGISKWKARRMVAAGHALESLPRTARALESGELSLDKTLELTRFATPETEEKLVRWAKRVQPVTIRERADREQRPHDEAVRAIERARYLRHSRDLDGAYDIEAKLPAADGALVVKTLERLADDLPDSPEDAAHNLRDAKRADALVALAATRVAADQDPDRATVVVHSVAETAEAGDVTGAHLEDGMALHPETARRLACDSRMELVDYADTERRVIAGVRDARRSPRPALRRAVLERDAYRCSFHGCEARSFLSTHHIRWHVRDHGPTDEDNLTLVCRTHHKLVHEFGWEVIRTPEGVVWLRPDGTPYVPGVPPGADPPPKTVPVGSLPSWMEELGEIDPVDAVYSLAAYIDDAVRPGRPLPLFATT